MENKNNQPNKQIPVYYTVIPNILIQSRLLDSIERQLVAIIASYGSAGGCNWSRASYKEYLGCGPRLLDRALRRLMFLRIITVVRGGWKPGTNRTRKETNRYVYEKNPYKWKVTKDIQLQIAKETDLMKMEPQVFEHEPFPNEEGFEISFQSKYPRLAPAKKGRKKSNQVSAPPQQTERQKWEQKKYKATHEGFAYLLSTYYFYLDDIELSKNPEGHPFTDEKKDYLDSLHQIYLHKVTGYLEEEEKALLNQVEMWIAEGKPFTNISDELLNIHREQKSKNTGEGH
ncbi:MAG: hypothetical protein ACK4VO_11895 [Pseudobdellovibrio sp.]